MKLMLVIISLGMLTSCEDPYYDIAHCDPECTVKVAEVINARSFKDTSGIRYLISNRYVSNMDTEKGKEEYECLKSRIDGEEIRIRRYGYSDTSIIVRILSHRITCT